MNEIIKKLIEKGFFHIIGANVLNKIFQFCNGIVLVRLLSKSEFGSYSYAQNVLNIFLLLNGMGVLYALLQFGSENPEKRRVLFKFGLKIGLVFNILLSVLIILYGIFIDTPNRESKIALFLMSLMPFFIFIFELIQIYFRTGLQNRSFAKLSNINTLLILVFSMIGAILLGLFGVIIGQYVSYIISIIIGIKHIIKRRERQSEKRKITDFNKKEFMEYSFYSILNNGASQLIFFIDIFLLGILIKNEELIAEYRTATLIPFALNFIPSSIMTFLYPYFARNKENVLWIRKYSIIVQKYLLIFNTFLVLLLILCAPLIIKLLFGSNYIDSIALFRILCIGYLINGSIRNPVGNILAMTRNVKFLLITNLLVAFINVILDIILIKSFSVTGAAITAVITMLLSSILYSSYFYNIKYRSKSYLTRKI